MSLTIRKAVVLGLIGSILLLGNILFIASWLAEKGMVDWARDLRAEYLTGTAITIVVVMLVLLVGPTRSLALPIRQRRVCDHELRLEGRYCPECGSRV